MLVSSVSNLEASGRLVRLFTKQYKLVPCEGFHVDAPYVAAMAWSPMKKGSIVEAILQRSWLQLVVLLRTAT